MSLINRPSFRELVRVSFSRPATSYSSIYRGGIITNKRCNSSQQLYVSDVYKDIILIVSDELPPSLAAALTPLLTDLFPNSVSMEHLKDRHTHCPPISTAQEKKKLRPNIFSRFTIALMRVYILSSVSATGYNVFFFI